MLHKCRVDGRREQHQTEVEVFNFKQDTLDEVDDDAEPELEELDNLSDRSSACDCPAHVHDRDTPLIIDKVGHFML